MLKAIRAKQLLDVNTGNLIPNPVILIENNRIVQIGSQVSMPTNVGLINLPELTLLPGLTDCHTHITYHYDSNGRFGFSNPDNQTVLNGAIENLRDTLRAGFTTIRDVGASNGIDFILRDLVNQGRIIGPRLLVSGEPIFSPTDDVNQRISKNPDVIKIFNGIRGPSQAVFNSQQIRSIVNQASQRGLPVAVHSFESVSTIESSDGGASTIEHGTFITEQAAEVMAHNGTTLVPTLSMPFNYLNNRNRFNFSPENWRHFERAAREGLSSVNLAKQRGVEIVLGTDSVAGAHGHNANEFLLLNQAGLTPLQCIQAGTIKAAKMLRIYDIGNIQVGNKADIIGITGNPLENLRYLLPENVKFVMKDGQIAQSY